MFTLFEFFFLLRYLFLFVSVFLFLLTSAKMATILNVFCHHFLNFDLVYNCTEFDVYIICRSGKKVGGCSWSSNKNKGREGLLESYSNTEPLKSPVLSKDFGSTKSQILYYSSSRWSELSGNVIW